MLQAQAEVISVIYASCPEDADTALGVQVLLVLKLKEGASLLGGEEGYAVSFSTEQAQQHEVLHGPWFCINVQLLMVWLNPG